MKTSDQTFDLSFRVVVYRDGDDWAAHALELDIVGCGDTPDHAWKELIAAIECQVSFALQTGDPSLIFKESPAEIVALWEETNRKSVEELFSPSPSPSPSSRGTRPTRDQTTLKSDGPLAKFYGLSGRKLEDLRKHRMELVCG
jgi:hypothetical protein